MKDAHPNPSRTKPADRVAPTVKLPGGDSDDSPLVITADGNRQSR